MGKQQHDSLELLRKKAEQLIAASHGNADELEAVTVKKIFHEVQIYQLELEMQNDELQLAAVELEQQRIKFTNLFELAPIGYFVTSKSGVIENANRAGLQLLGTEKIMLLSKPLLLHVYKEDIDIFYSYFNQLFLTFEAQSCQLRFINAQKQILSVQVEGIALQTAAMPVCYLTVTDITKKQQAEQALKEAKKTLEIALDASLTGIWEMDILSGKMYLDEFCCAMYGFKTDGFDQKYSTLISCIYPEDREMVEEQIRKTIAQENEFNLRFRIGLPETNLRYIQARAQVITTSPDKKHLTGTFTDISEKMLMEMQSDNLHEAQQQMILAAGLQAEENEKKRISEVLHNGIAQMLYAIKLNVGQLQSGADEQLLDQINALLNQSIKDVRNISFELAPAILTDFGLAATLQDLAMRLSNKKLVITTNVNGISKLLDFQLQLNIFRIIQELINNSIKHASASKIMIGVFKKNKLIYISVTDNGVGFETIKNNATPKGIGLTSIKNRLRLYKGTLKIASQPNAGTRVDIVLEPV